MPACTHCEFGLFSPEAFFHFKCSVHADGQSYNGVSSSVPKLSAWLQLECSAVLCCDYIFKVIQEQYFNSLWTLTFRSSRIKINIKRVLILIVSVDRIPTIAVKAMWACICTYRWVHRYFCFDIFKCAGCCLVYHGKIQRVNNDYNNTLKIRLCHVFCLNLSIFPLDQSALLFRSVE